MVSEHQGEDEVDACQISSSAHEIIVARLQREHKQMQADLAQAQKALRDKTQKLADLPKTHYDSLQSLAGKHRKKLAELKSNLESEIADRDEKIKTLPSDNKALTVKVDLFMKQGDEKGVADISLRARYAKL